MEREGRIQIRDRLLSDVWGYDAMSDTRTVDTNVRWLREKLGEEGRYIETIYGFGAASRHQRSRLIKELLVPYPAESPARVSERLDASSFMI